MPVSWFGFVKTVRLDELAEVSLEYTKTIVLSYSNANLENQSRLPKHTFSNQKAVNQRLCSLR